MSDDGMCTNPAARRTFSRRKLLAKWQRDPRWKAMLQKHAHTPNSECVYCHRKHGQVWVNSKGKETIVRLTINHASRHLYLNEDLYLHWDPQYMEITCRMCNKKYEVGQKPCPVCLKEGKISYILDRDIECNSCYLKKHPEELIKSKEGTQRFKESVKQYNANRFKKARDSKVKHPCSYRLISGRCSASTPSQCTYSPTKAVKNCEKFKHKGVKKL